MKKKNLCKRCKQQKDTFTALCADCLHLVRASKYRSYGRDDLPEVMKDDATTLRLSSRYTG